MRATVYLLPVLKCFSMPPVFIAPELLCKSCMMMITTALHYISLLVSGFFIIMSPAEGLHFSALVYLVIVSCVRNTGPYGCVFATGCQG